MSGRWEFFLLLLWFYGRMNRIDANPLHLHLRDLKRSRCAEDVMARVDFQSLQTDPSVANMPLLSISRMFQTPTFPFVRPTHMTIIPSPYISTKKDAQRPIDPTSIVVIKFIPKDRRLLPLSQKYQNTKACIVYCFRSRDL
jgi:hypothetical protein